MKRRVLLPAVLAVASAAALLGACKATDTAGNVSSNSASASKTTGQSNTSAKPSPPAGTTELQADTIRRISVAELQEMVESGKVAIYDTRAKMQYDQEHIKGALSLPQSEAEARAGELPRDRTLVFYCT